MTSEEKQKTLATFIQEQKWDLNDVLSTLPLLTASAMVQSGDAFGYLGRVVNVMVHAIPEFQAITDAVAEETEDGSE
jgi:hypothetical protein